MEEWKTLLKEKLLTQIEEKQKLNQEIIYDLNTLTDPETILKAYWQIRKNLNHISNVYGGLIRDVSFNYKKQHLEASSDEIYYYEKLLLQGRSAFPESNIRYDYYIELATLEYNFFIENKYTMTKKRRENLFLYSYKDDDVNDINLHVILNNLKQSQKLLEINIMWHLLNKDYDGLFLSYDVVGNLYISMYQLLNLEKTSYKDQLDELILFSYLNFTLSYEYKLVNDEPEVHREGIIDIPYSNLFYKFFQKEGFNNYYSIQEKLNFLQKYYYDKLKGTVIIEKLKELVEKKSILTTHKKKDIFYKKDREFETESLEHIQTEDNEIMSNTIIQHLKGKDNESDILEFKPYIHDKIRIAKAICGFCNRFLLTEENNYLVFCIKDRKNLRKDSDIFDRFIPIDDVLKNSKVKDIEEFKKKINYISKIHLDPIPDSCYTIRCLNIKDKLNTIIDTEVIIIFFHRFVLDRPIRLKSDDHIYIRRQSETTQASTDEIIQLTKKC